MDEIRQRLEALADPGYRQFTSSLLPGVPHILGVRLPHLRTLARQIAQDDWRAYLHHAADNSFEELMLQGMVIGCAKTTVEETLLYTQRFLPKIDNWSVCDSFCSSLKATRRHPQQVWEFLQPCFGDSREYVVRFGVVMLLDYFVTEEHLDAVLNILDGIQHPGYYVKMAVAWAVSVCFFQFPQHTTAYLQSCSLDSFTYQKSLQKIIDSRRVSDEQKENVRRLRTVSRS